MSSEHSRDRAARDCLCLTVDGSALLEIDRGHGIPGRQRQLFEQIDADLAAGFELDGVAVDAPDESQCARFVIAELLKALDAGQHEAVRFLCTYLALRQPRLRAIHAETAAHEHAVTLQFN